MRREKEKNSAGDQVELNELTKRIIGAAIEVHRHLGPGLLESAYGEKPESLIACGGDEWQSGGFWGCRPQGLFP